MSAWRSPAGQRNFWYRGRPGGEHQACPCGCGLPGNVRQELHLSRDPGGRLCGWSVWENRKILGPDQDAGLRERLMEVVA